MQQNPYACMRVLHACIAYPTECESREKEEEEKKKTIAFYGQRDTPYIIIFNNIFLLILPSGSDDTAVSHTVCVERVCDVCVRCVCVCMQSVCAKNVHACKLEMNTHSKGVSSSKRSRTKQSHVQHTHSPRSLSTHNANGICKCGIENDCLIVVCERSVFRYM